MPVNPTLQEQPLASAARTKHNDLEKNIPEDAEILHKAENPWRPNHRLEMRTEVGYESLLANVVKIIFAKYLLSALCTAVDRK